MFVRPYSVSGKPWRRVRKAGAYHKPRSLLASFFPESLNRTSTSRTTFRKVRFEKYKMNHFRNVGDLRAGAVLKNKFLLVSSPPTLKPSLHVPIFSPDSAKAVNFPSSDIPRLTTPQSKHNPRSQDLYFAELVLLNATLQQLQAHAESGSYSANPVANLAVDSILGTREVGMTTTNLHTTSSFFAGKKLRRVEELRNETRRTGCES